MSSKRRLRRKQCAGKKRHKTADGAMVEIKIIRQRFGHQGQIARDARGATCITSAIRLVETGSVQDTEVDGDG